MDLFAVVQQISADEAVNGLLGFCGIAFVVMCAGIFALYGRR